jgi:hypothetical protein
MLYVSDCAGKVRPSGREVDRGDRGGVLCHVQQALSRRRRSPS